MRIVSAYQTLSTSAVLILASVPLIDLLAEEMEGDLSAPLGAHLLNKPAGNRSREGGHPQGWKAQTRREMADEMAWGPIRELDTPSDPGARHLAG